ncbi:MAG: hypothetical protein H6961_02430 [Chromatiaceae bacterium]|nr:hypothetical protein [Chromatiaceae bacterium]MCP5437749.1 hypothetical protein [Chromatiaceae bacterium]
MIIHCSKKLATKLPEVSSTPLQETSPLGSWHAHLFTLDRRQCVMFCHDATRYCLFLAGLRKPHFAELGSKWFRELFTATLAVVGVPDTKIKKVELMLGPVRFDTATDRSVQGSINIARQDLQARVFQLPNVMDLDPLKVSVWLNQRPVTVRGKFIHPDREMQQRLAEVG